MNKEIYDQTVINFHSQLILKEFTEHGIPERKRINNFVNSAMEAFVSNFNDSLAKKFLSNLETKITPQSTLNEMLSEYPNQFFNFTDGRDLIDKQARENVSRFLKSLLSLGNELNTIKSESGIPPRLLDTAKKEIVERFEVSLDKFGHNLCAYSKYDIQLGIRMIEDTLYASKLPEFELTKDLLKQPLAEKLVNHIKYEDNHSPSHSNKILTQFLETPATRKMQP